MANQNLAHSSLSRNCSGCDKPFTAVRKPRLQGTQVFVSTAPGSAGRVGIVPALLCGACVALVQGGTSPLHLPAMVKACETLEALVLADREGVLQ